MDSAKMASEDLWDHPDTTVSPFTPIDQTDFLKEEMERRKARSAFRSIVIEDFKNVWNHPKLPRSCYLSNFDDKRLHIRNKIYELSKEPLTEKFVVLQSQYRFVRPMGGMWMVVAHEKIDDADEEKLKEWFNDVKKPLANRAEFELWSKSSDALDLSLVVQSMCLGERCIIRRRNQKEKGKDVTYNLEVFECVEAWVSHDVAADPHLLRACRLQDQLKIERAAMDAEVRLHFRMYKRETGKEVDMKGENGWELVVDTRSRATADSDGAHSFKLGQGTELPCLEEVVKEMFQFEEAKGRFFSRASLAAGPYPPPQERDDLPWLQLEALDLSVWAGADLAGYDLLFLDLEVLKITSVGNLSPVTLGERLEESHRCRILGNSFLARKSYQRALTRYDKAFHVISNGQLPEQTVPAALRDAAKSAMLNAILARIGLEDWSIGATVASLVLDSDPENVKALSRGALCQRHLGNFEQAFAWIDLAVALAPQDKQIRAERSRIKAEKSAEEKRAISALKGLKKHENWGIAEYEEKLLESQLDEIEKRRKAELEGGYSLVG